MTTPWISSTFPAATPPFEDPFSPSRCSASRSSSFSSSRFSVVACSTWSPLVPKPGSAEPLGTRDDFHDLLRDVRLTLTVGLEGEVVDQVGGVLGRVAHRSHARAVL